MSFSSIRAGYALSATGSTSQTGGSISAVLGTPSANMVYGANPDVIYSLGMQIASGVTLTLNLATGAVTGSAAGTAQVETATVVAAAGCTSNGNLPVTITGAAISGSPLTINVALTTVTHTTAALIATAIRTAVNAVSAVSTFYTAAGTSAAFTLTKAGIFGANDVTLNVAWPASLGVSAVTTSSDTTAGVMASMAYRLTTAATSEPIAWDTKDYEGRTLATATKLYGCLVKSTTAGAITVTATDGAGTGFVAATPFIIPGVFHPAGAHPWAADSITFTASGNAVLTLDIHAGT